MKNRKTLLLVLVITALLYSFNNIETKAQQFNVGDNDINMMIGFGRTYGYGSYGNTGGLPPISVSIDHGWRDDIGPGVISLGGYVGASTIKYEYSYFSTNYSWKYTDIVVAARSTYHYYLIDELDTYGGLMLGIRYSSSSYSGTAWTGYTDYSGVHGLFAGFVGAKYYFSENLAAMAELGYGVAYFNFGICLKM